MKEERGMGEEAEWFPLEKELVESYEFQEASKTARLYYIHALDRANRAKLKRDDIMQPKGTWYWADGEAATALGCATKTIQRAREHFCQREWIEYTPGRQDRYGRGLATTYTHVHGSMPEECRRYAQIDRGTFRWVAQHMYRGAVGADEVLVWVMLAYYRGLYDQKKNGQFHATLSKVGWPGRSSGCVAIDGSVAGVRVLR